jgi:hypothetical protein
MMKLCTVTVLILGLALVGCKKESPQGGPGAAKTSTTTTNDGTTTTTTKQSGDRDDTFTLEVPSGTTGVTQGKREEVTITVSRGKNFKQPVKLSFAAPAGVKIVPADVTVKGDESRTKVFVESQDTAAVGKGTVTVTGTPETGKAVSVPMEIDVRKKS